uniref:Cell division cycle protein 123 n=1 Tax=Arcella intermedia TaxID=1963864 RepID=A0A6B2LBB7_9EUKA
MSLEAAKAIMEGYTKRANNEPWDWKQNDHLTQLAAQIDQLKQGFQTKDIFVRLSSRSPKDAAIGQRGVGIYKEAKKKIVALATELNDTLSTEDNTKLHALYVTGTEALRIQNGEQAIDLFLSSARIQDDLRQYTLHPNQDFNVVVREFANFEVELEFRGFVYAKKLTAITQYNQFCYFPRVVKNKEYLHKVMKQFIEEELVQKVSLNNFVIDIILISDSTDQPYSNLKVYIVEINPFAEFAGEGLFSWTDPHEVAILKGRSPFEFRVVEKPPKDAIKLIDKEWRTFVEADKD